MARYNVFDASNNYVYGDSYAYAYTAGTSSTNPYTLLGSPGDDLRADPPVYTVKGITIGEKDDSPLAWLDRRVDEMRVALSPNNSRLPGVPTRRNDGLDSGIRA